MRTRVFITVVIVFGFLCGISYAETAEWDEGYVTRVMGRPSDTEPGGEWDILWKDQIWLPVIKQWFCCGLVVW